MGKDNLHRLRDGEGEPSKEIPWFPDAPLYYLSRLKLERFRQMTTTNPASTPVDMDGLFDYVMRLEPTTFVREFNLNMDSKDEVDAFMRLCDNGKEIYGKK